MNYNFESWSIKRWWTKKKFSYIIIVWILSFLIINLLM